MQEDIPELILRVLSYRCLNVRETKYLIWKFGFRKTLKDIAKLDDKKVSRQAISIVIRMAYKKICLIQKIIV